MGWCVSVPHCNLCNHCCSLSTCTRPHVHIYNVHMPATEQFLFRLITIARITELNLPLCVQWPLHVCFHRYFTFCLHSLYYLKYPTHVLSLLSYVVIKILPTEYQLEGSPNAISQVNIILYTNVKFLFNK